MFNNQNTYENKQYKQLTIKKIIATNIGIYILLYNTNDDDATVNLHSVSNSKKLPNVNR